MQRKFQETLTATVKMNEKTLNFYVEQIFGWNLVCNGNIVKLANLKNNLEVFFSAQNDKLVMLNREEMLKLIGNSASLTYPEIISYFTII